MATGSEEGNDVRGWTIVHDQIRWVVADAVDQVLAAGQSVPRIMALQRWWGSFAGSLRHHFAAEDARVSPTLAAARSDAADQLRLLETQHRDLERLIETVDRRMSLVPASWPDPYDALADDIRALRLALDEHLRREEALAVPLLRDQVSAGEWRLLQRDMVKGLGPREVADLLPRILAVARDEEDRDLMLHRVPPPVRLLNRLVLEPRYRRMRSALPCGDRG